MIDFRGSRGCWDSPDFACMYGGQNPHRTGGHPMVSSMTTILQRFTDEWSALLPPDAILTVCGEIGLFHAGTRVLLKLVIAPLLIHDLARVQAVHPSVQP